jgi:uncharacterized CHY-type Zn-finger protein
MASVEVVAQDCRLCGTELIDKEEERVGICPWCQRAFYPLKQEVK